jgi:hypothetical protein
MGITDDRGRAMRAGEETLGSGRAAMVIMGGAPGHGGARWRRVTSGPGWDGWAAAPRKRVAWDGSSSEPWQDGAMKLRIFTERSRGADYQTLRAVALATEELGFDVLQIRPLPGDGRIGAPGRPIPGSRWAPWPSRPAASGSGPW